MSKKKSSILIGSFLFLATCVFFVLSGCAHNEPTATIEDNIFLKVPRSQSDDVEENSHELWGADGPQLVNPGVHEATNQSSDE